MALKVQQFLFVVISVFIGSAAPAFLANAANIWEISASTWQIIVSSGVAGVVTYLVMYFAPQNKQFGLGSKGSK
jgi:hypothetical protein